MEEGDRVGIGTSGGAWVNSRTVVSCCYAEQLSYFSPSNTLAGYVGIPRLLAFAYIYKNNWFVQKISPINAICFSVDHKRVSVCGFWFVG